MCWHSLDVQLEFSLGMFHTALTEIAGGQDAAGKKSGSKSGASGIRNNFEFQKLLRDVEAEMAMIRIGKDGRTKADRHPKMVQTLQLVCLLAGIRNHTDYDSCSTIFSSPMRMNENMGSRMIPERWYSAHSVTVF